MPNEQIKDMMNAETWIGADKAVALGFADRKSNAMASADQNKWDLSAYANAPAKNETEQSVDETSDETKPFRSRERIDLAKAESFNKETLSTD